MITSIEQLIKEKVQAALQSERMRVASTLLTPVARPVQTVKEAAPAQGKSSVNDRRQKKMLQIKKHSGQLQAHAAQMATTKDRGAAIKRKEKMVVLNHKINLNKAELKAIHD